MFQSRFSLCFYRWCRLFYKWGRMSGDLSRLQEVNLFASLAEMIHLSSELILRLSSAHIWLMDVFNVGGTNQWMGGYVDFHKHRSHTHILLFSKGNKCICLVCVTVEAQRYYRPNLKIILISSLKSSSLKQQPIRKKLQITGRLRTLASFMTLRGLRLSNQFLSSHWASLQIIWWKR